MKQKDIAFVVKGVLNATKVNCEFKMAFIPKGWTCLNIEKATKDITKVIIDEGGGIPQSILPNIFDPYFTTKPDGDGLGLTMAFTIIKNHGGIIEVDTKVGKGSTFTIFIPASSDTFLKGEMVMLDPTLEKGRILIMDDEEPIRKILGGMLKRLGYDVDFAENGEEAIEKYNKGELKPTQGPSVNSKFGLPPKN